MHRKELLSGSFGPLQGPITTLTSLAAFKARFQQPAIPSSMPSMPSAAQQPSQDVSFGSLPPQQPSKVASDSQDQRPAQHSLAGLASEEPSSAVMSSGEEHNTSNISQHSHAVAAALTNRLGGEAHHVAKDSEAGHDRQHATSPSISKEGASATGPPSSQPAQSEVHMLWEDPANITAAREALVTFLQKSGLLKHLQIDSVVSSSLAPRLCITESSPLLTRPAPTICNTKSMPCKDVPELVAYCQLQRSRLPCRHHTVLVRSILELWNSPTARMATWSPRQSTQ